jgi:hypothetical protein
MWKKPVETNVCDALVGVGTRSRLVRLDELFGSKRYTSRPSPIQPGHVFEQLEKAKLIMEIENGKDDLRIEIRPACLRPAADGWQQPKGTEVREVIARCGLTMTGVERFLGLSSKSGGRQIRRWISEEASIPYTAWAILCARAGFGDIWEHGE